MTRGDDALASIHQGWYPLLESRALGVGERLPVDVLGHALVAFRALDGTAGVLKRACPHMGGDLARGTVTADGLECPIHHWRFDRRGRRACADRVPSGAACQASLVSAERYGIVFVHFGPEVLFDLPSTAAPVHLSRAKVREMDFHYTMPTVFGFDSEHFDSVHHRDLLDFRLYQHEPFHLGTTIVAGVQGKHFGDRLMRRAGLGEVTTAIDYWGANIVFGRHEKSGTYALITCMPLTVTRSRAFVVVMQERASGGPFRRAFGRLRFEAVKPLLLGGFIAQDEKALDGVRFDAECARLAPDNPVRDWLAHDARLPVVATSRLLD